MGFFQHFYGIQDQTRIIMGPKCNQRELIKIWKELQWDDYL